MDAQNYQKFDMSPKNFRFKIFLKIPKIFLICKDLGFYHSKIEQKFKFEIDNGREASW